MNRLRDLEITAHWQSAKLEVLSFFQNAEVGSDRGDATAVLAPTWTSLAATANYILLWS